MINFLLKIGMTIPVILAETTLLLVCEICWVFTLEDKFMCNDFLKMTKTIWDK